MYSYVANCASCPPGYPGALRGYGQEPEAAPPGQHVRAAASYFGKNKHLYPPSMRRTIAGRINKAKKRFGVGGQPATA